MAKVNTLDRAAYYNYMKLDMGDKVLATYIWIDGTGEVSRVRKFLCTLIWPKQFLTPVVVFIVDHLIVYVPECNFRLCFTTATVGHFLITNCIVLY